MLKNCAHPAALMRLARRCCLSRWAVCTVAGTIVSCAWTRDRATLWWTSWRWRRTAVVSPLGIGETVGAVVPVAAGIARSIARLHPAEAGLEGTVYPQHHLLHDVAADLAVVGHRLVA